jgi:hypothetical protein
LAAPFVSETEVPPKTGAAEFCWELFAAGYCRDHLSVRRAPLGQPFFSMRMQTDLHFSSAFKLCPYRRILIYFAIQTFFGSVKKPAYAKATARQAQRFLAQKRFC